MDTPYHETDGKVESSEMADDSASGYLKDLYLKPGCTWKSRESGIETYCGG
jgi:hypothetical protein